MAVITDAEWIIRQLRIEYLLSEDPLAERILAFPDYRLSLHQPPTQANNSNSSGDSSSPNMISYVDDSFRERGLCYSPNIFYTEAELGSSLANGRQQRVAAAQQQRMRNQINTTTMNTSSAQQKAVAPTQQMLRLAGGRPPVELQFTKTVAPQDPDSQIKQPPASGLLGSLIKGSSSRSNPFAKEFSFICGKGEQHPIQLLIYFPQSQQPSVPLKLLVKREATVHEVIGYTLYEYVEQKLQPILDPNGGMDNAERWQMRIVEEDGTIDEDFPALERLRKISKFSFDQFAIVPSQSLTKTTSSPEQAKAEPATGSQTAMTTSLPSSASTGSRPRGPPVFVKIHLYSTLEVKQTTTVALTGDMLFSEVLQLCCTKRKINPNEYTLKMADTKTDVPLDKTLESLGIQELCILRKKTGPSAGDIFLRPPDEQDENEEDADQMPYLAEEYTSVYKRYQVSRKMPMIMGRQDRALAIDGDYIYLLPPESKNLFDTVKTSSFHVSAVLSCQVVKKGMTSFKLTAQRDGKEVKTYELDASTPQEAGECLCVEMVGTR